MARRDDMMKAWGFSADPFAQHVAENEERLEQSFVAPNYFDDVVGNPDRPKPTVVFGSRGEGKSTLCRMVERRLRALEHPPLIVDATDFSDWSVAQLDASSDGVSLHDHVWRILEAAAIALVRALEGNPRMLDGLSAVDRAQLESIVVGLFASTDARGHEHRLLALLDDTAKGGSLRRISRYLRRKRAELEHAKVQNDKVGWLLLVLKLIAPATPKALRSSNVASQTILDEFVRLVRILGFPSMYVLVDKVDEFDAVVNRPDRIVKLVAPLVRSVRFLESRDLGIKIFLPEEVRRDLDGLRTDRIRTHEIQWDEHRLCTFLRARIRAYSDGRHDGLGHMLADYATFEPKLLRASARAPRNMLRILDLIVGRHCERDSPAVVIARPDMEAGLRTFIEYRTREGGLELYEARLDAWDREHRSKNDDS